VLPLSIRFSIQLAASVAGARGRARPGVGGADDLKHDGDLS
jgi:hypothetical protein